MAKEKLTPKQEEIQLLERLLEMDGYFSDRFKNDIPLMIQNVKNDYPIELGLKITRDADDMKLAIRNLQDCVIKKHKTIDQLNAVIVTKIECIEEQDARLNNILEVIIQANDQCLTVVPQGLFIIQDIIEMKFRNGITLTANEQDYILSKINVKP